MTEISIQHAQMDNAEKNSPLDKEELEKAMKRFDFVRRDCLRLNARVTHTLLQLETTPDASTIFLLLDRCSELATGLDEMLKHYNTIDTMTATCQ